MSITVGAGTYDCSANKKTAMIYRNTEKDGSYTKIKELSLKQVQYAKICQYYGHRRKCRSESLHHGFGFECSRQKTVRRLTMDIPNELETMTILNK